MKTHPSFIQNARVERGWQRSFQKQGLYSVLGLAAVATLIGAAISVATAFPTSKYLYATEGWIGPGVDTDAEGLADSVELQLGSSPYVPDSDSDGATDLVEAIYGTSPTNPLSRPTPAMLSKARASVFGFIEGGDFHLVVAISVPDGNISSITSAGSLLFAPQIAGYSGPQVVDLNPLVLTGMLQSQTASIGASARVFSSDSWFPKDVLNAFTGDDGYVQFSIAFAATVSGTAVGAVSYYTTTANFDASLASVASLQLNPQTPGTGAFKPLQPVSLPPTWVSDSACYVESAMVGLEYGAIVVLEGVSAECVPQEGTSCNPIACQELVGRIFRMVDPCSLGVCE